MIAQAGKKRSPRKKKAHNQAGHDQNRASSSRPRMAPPPASSAAWDGHDGAVGMAPLKMNSPRVLAPLPGRGASPNSPRLGRAPLKQPAQQYGLGGSAGAARPGTAFV